MNEKKCDEQLHDDRWLYDRVLIVNGLLDAMCCAEIYDPSINFFHADLFYSFFMRHHRRHQDTTWTNIKYTRRNRTTVFSATDRATTLVADDKSKVLYGSTANKPEKEVVVFSLLKRLNKIAFIES